LKEGLIALGSILWAIQVLLLKLCGAAKQIETLWILKRERALLLLMQAQELLPALLLMEQTPQAMQRGAPAGLLAEGLAPKSFSPAPIPTLSRALRHIAQLSEAAWEPSAVYALSFLKQGLIARLPGQQLSQMNPIWRKLLEQTLTRLLMSPQT